MPAVAVQCPHCTQSYSVDDTLVGRKARCKGCGKTFALTPSTEFSITPSGSGLPSTLTSEPGPTALAQSFPLPETIGRFVVKQRLGAGAFGTVYRATDPVLGREVAIKVPQPGLLQSPGAAERFLREARAVAQLRHSNIVTLFETGLDRGDHYIATEFIEGTTLADAVAETGLEPRRAAEAVAALADALHFAHHRGIVHRDVKPANVMLDTEGRPHLMDFGLARFEGASGEKLTQDGAILGTPVYMPPEQATASGVEITAASDQYSLGATFYELLTGKTPFSGPPEIVIFNLVHREPPAPRTLRPEIPPALETICLKAMAKSPADRYPSCRELAADLRRWLQDVPIRARRAGTTERLGRWLRGHRVTASLAAVLVVGLLALAGWIIGTTVPRTSSPSTRISDRVASGSRGVDEGRPEAVRRVLSEHRGAGDGLPPVLGEHPTPPRSKAPSTKTEPAPPAPPRKPPKPDPKLVYAQRIQAAYQACTVGRRTEAVRFLDECPVELRGWEWSYCMRLSRSHPDPIILKGHNGPVHCIAFSPDGKRLATGGGDRTVRIWDIAKREGTVRNGHAEPVAEVQFTADGKHILSFAWGGLMDEWDPSSEEPTRTVRFANLKGLSAVAISPDAKWIAGGWKDGKIHVSETRKDGLEDFGAEDEHTKPILRLAFSPDGKKILSRTMDGWTIRYRGPELLAASRQKVSKILSRPDFSRRTDSIPRDANPRKSAAAKAKAAAFKLVEASPDGLHVAAASGGDISLFHLESGRLVRKIPSHPKTVTALAFSRDGRWIASDGDDRTIHIRDALTGRLRASLAGHKQDLTSIRFGKDDTLLAASSLDGNVYLWPVGDGVAERSVELAAGGPGAEDARRESRFSADSKALFMIEESAVGLMSLVSWDAQTLQPIHKADGVIGTSPDLMLVARFDSGRITLIDASGQAPPHPLGIVDPVFRADGLKDSMSIRAIPLDASRCAVLIQRNRGASNAGHSIGVWDENRPGWVWSTERDGSVSMLGAVALRAGAQTGNRVTAWDGLILRRNDSVINILSIADGSEVLSQLGNSYQVAPRGGLVAIFSGDRDAGGVAWNLEQREPVVKFSGTRVVFDPVGDRMVTWGGPTPGVTIWELPAGRSVKVLASAGGDAAFSPDGRRLAAHRGSSLVILDADTGGEILELPDSPGTPIFSPDGLKLACVGEKLTIRSGGPTGTPSVPTGSNASR